MERKRVERGWISRYPACHRAFPIRARRTRVATIGGFPVEARCIPCSRLIHPSFFRGPSRGYCVTGGGCYAAANKHEFAEFSCCTLPRTREREREFGGSLCAHDDSTPEQGMAEYGILDIKVPAFICVSFFFFFFFFSSLERY